LNIETQVEQQQQERQSFLSAVVGELTRRKVLRTVGAYAIAVFAVLQLLDAAAEPLRLPNWLPTFVVVGLILGFPVVFVLAWQFEITKDGVHRTRAAGLLSRSQSSLLFSFMMVATVGLGYGIYEYYSGILQEDEVAQETSRAFSAPENSIAVLPFADLSAGADQGPFADGITEELLNLLTQVDGLHVAARTSSFAFRDPQKDIREIGQLLNVRSVLEGSVRTSGNRVRLTAQLINVEDGFHIWSQVYDREMSDLFAIQDEVASEIASALVDSFEGLEIRPGGRADNMAAAEAYRTGRLLWWRRTPEDLQRAAERFAEALQHDPTFAPAYAALADTWLLLSLYGNLGIMEAIEKANPMIDRALAMDPGSAEAFAALGLARNNLEQYDASESALRHAIELNPNYVPAHLWLSTTLEAQGRYPEQHQVLEQALELDPLNELLAVNFADNLSVRGEWDRARKILSEQIAFRPDSTTMLRSLAAHELFHGNLVEGFRLAYRSHSLQPEDPSDMSTLANAWLTLGAPEEAESLLSEGLEKHPNNAQLQNLYWQVLLVSGRHEEGKSLVQQWQQEAGEDAPEFMTRNFNAQLGLLTLREGDFGTAADYFTAAIDSDETGKYDGFKILILTMAAFALDHEGNTEQAARLIAAAQRDVRRARVNGVDNPDIDYTEAVLLAMNRDPDAAVAKLQDAYDAGFRFKWLLQIDPRMDSIRSHPGYVAIRDQIEEDVDSALQEVRALELASL